MAKIAVIHTGDSSSVFRRTVNTREWEAYRDNAADIASALGVLGHEAIRLTDGRSLIAELSEQHPDLVWICSGGIQGRDPATHLPALLEMLGLDYVGSRPLAAGSADNKARAKALLHGLGVRTPEFSVVAAGAAPTRSVASRYPVVVKPVCGMCSCGVFRAASFSQLAAAVAALQRRYHDDVLIERYVDGIDVTVGVLQDAAGMLRCLPPLQRFFAARDDPKHAHFSLPHRNSELREGPPMAADLAETERQAVCAMAETAFRGLGLRHVGRLDFRISGSEIWFLEANHKPDLTRTSLLAMSARLAGLDHHELIGHILASAVP
jgi:D-alanine-D-alanine ligase